MEAWVWQEVPASQGRYQVISAEGAKRKSFGSANSLQEAMRIARAVIDLGLDKAPGIRRG